MKTLKILVTSLTLTLALSSFTAFAFTDTSNHKYEEAIDYAFNEEIVNGYDDGTFKPDEKINRAEFTKIIIETINKTDLKKYKANCFDDVFPAQWYSKYVCYAKKKDIINGYEDNTFKGTENINIVEAAKILFITYDLNHGNKNAKWYSSYISKLEEKKAIPNSITSLDQKITRAEMTEMIWRLETKQKKEKTSNLLQNEEDNENQEEEETTNNNNQEPVETPNNTDPEGEPEENTTSTNSSGSCNTIPTDIPSNLDLDEIEEQWLEWINDERNSRGLHPYTLNKQLSRTATIWSEEAKQRGYIDHRRNEGDSYYNYNIITDWFKDLGLEFQNVNRVTHTENITWGVFTCSKSDCTDTALDTMKNWGFDNYMNEEGRDYSPHFNSIVNNYFNEIGFGLSVDEGNKYYLTIHYGTEITSNPLPICN